MTVAAKSQPTAFVCADWSRDPQAREVYAAGRTGLADGASGRRMDYRVRRRKGAAGGRFARGRGVDRIRCAHRRALILPRGGAVPHVPRMASRALERDRPAAVRRGGGVVRGAAVLRGAEGQGGPEGLRAADGLVRGGAASAGRPGHTREAGVRRQWHSGHRWFCGDGRVEWPGTARGEGRRLALCRELRGSPRWWAVGRG